MTDSDALAVRHVEDGVCTLMLNRARARNALSLAMIEALITELDAIEQDDSVRVIVLAGAGPAFCAGHDLKELKNNPDPSATEVVFSRCSDLMMKLIRMPQPVIAKVHGIATAAGCQLVATADLAIAAKSAKFATPGVNIGLFCTTPSVAVSRSVNRKKAMEMLLTGEPMSAVAAEASGLINAAVPDEELDDAVDALAQMIKSKSARILSIGKRAFYEQIEKPMADSYTYAAAVMTQNMLEDDCTEGISAFVEKRAPEWAS
jgi:enoyl-CoA hydratase/carnithine racemase